MLNKKETGSYYTPTTLSRFLARHIVQKYLRVNDISILEPSCGDGQFISSLFDSLDLNTTDSISIDLFDIDKKELNNAKALIPSSNKIKKGIYHQDYLKYHLDNNKKYSLIIGNPPYIKRKNLQKLQLKSCDEVHETFKDSNKLITSNGKINNIWIAFVEAAIMSLKQNGILCFVIPSEVLQVKYAKELRALIIDEFDRVEVFAFNELIFEGIQQDVIVLIGVKGIENINEHGFSFYQVDELEDLNEPRFTEKHNNIHRTTLDKWTNYILTDEELDFIDEKRSEYSSISGYCDKAQVGIVSAANDYFILTDKELKQNELTRFRSVIKPILPKGALVPNVANFTNLDFNLLKANDVKVNFLLFPNLPKTELNQKIINYLNKGEEKKEDNSGELHKRYKMTLRDNWYHVPSTWVSEGLFVKRCHKYPKIFVNEANSLATDSFYRIITKNQYNIRNLVFSFYNSLTFVLAELEGRFYGGGVLELTPNEFKELSIPYNDNITDEEFNTLDEMLRNDIDIENILAFTNSILIPDLDTIKLERIRIKLVNRRLKESESNESKVKTIIQKEIEIISA
ncbi:adenine-specific DNA-methyltransferase [Aquimarina sp. EL_43]|uniref:Eco57I restriction-modification methylase domain-containing protein n=1 Tax=unclassified Aquimarina TaxID=2627091 RepID=UPI0018C9C512|nr:MULTISPECIES: N-6 DNA methylase [unclassified Aquimarina]MBG6129527.1 adenine-specific DNA-methyltransferase [Aquimarina sp. EL_35]MBG6150592.1 adenine-specific DNA-methyltransferase [Aquimarina sp. EL_32]MBG6168100.1 adenine-specific DNA-methyltransferase [Aquimarina sp. EL_43]